MFWNLLKPILFDHMGVESKYQPKDRQVFIENLIRDATRTIHQLFVTIPNDKMYEWSDEDIKTFKRDWPDENLD